MSSETTYSYKQIGEKTVVVLHSDNLDYRCTESLKKNLEALAQQGTTHIVLDLSQVKFMDSSGLSALLLGKRVTDEAGGSFAICGLHGYVNNLVASTNLNQTIKVYPEGWENSLAD